jgi:hypothetical protein
VRFREFREGKDGGRSTHGHSPHEVKKKGGKKREGKEEKNDINEKARTLRDGDILSYSLA